MEGDCSYRSRGGPLHIERKRVIYFVTFRLADSLPASVNHTLASPEDSPHVVRRIERTLDRGHGSCWLRKPQIASIVRNALHHGDGADYVLGPWCIMPTHVHVLVSPLPPTTLSQMLHSWKSYSASRANKALGRKGRFWQREYFERIVRSLKQLKNYQNYILSNPGRAGLENWPWAGPGDTEGMLSH
jgi:REP element-mobilizing transposase RayT